MDSESRAAQTKKNEASSQLSSDYCDEDGSAAANRPNANPFLAPVTPDTNKENGDFPVDISISLTVKKKLSFKSNSKTNRNEFPSTPVDGSSSPQTPKDSVFDPFTPGPHDLVLAPHCEKFFDEARATIARHLTFRSSFEDFRNTGIGDNVESLSDEEMFESVYENLLEVIISMQTEGALAEISGLGCDFDASRTPPPVSRLSGVIETCPGAPVKPTGRPKIIDLGLCRKLDF